ncbi:CYTH domain-containing protein [Myroides injenensis]|uniref:CYTH domain-containing protein n=1 Tax=Myroides injenensis TaxID=1183151 RepID=UPI00028990D5|nr:CYTH domain-containing protein [Myroides injenensis]
MIEIERKFLLNNKNFVQQAYKYNHIAQGYLNSNPERTVRIRIKDQQAYITIKGKSNQAGTSRFEWEKEIPLEEGKQLISLCEDFIIEKTRYLVKSNHHIFEIDVFHGKNEGLIMAEIELQNENEDFEKPEWLGKEVTGDKRYYNSYLSTTPYKNW